MTDKLTDVELDLIFYIERFHATNGVAPTDNQLNQRFTGLTDELLTGFKANPLVKRSFRARGIIYPPMEDRLTAAQMHAVAVMTDLVDRRSDEKKLRDLGITTRQWATWGLDSTFAEYLRDRSERMLDNSVHEAHRGLMKGVRNGNVASVKALYEITGRFRPDGEVQIDVQRILHTFIEVIQKYVKDPVVLHAIAMDLSSYASAETMSTGLTNQMMSNARAVTMQGDLVPSISAPKPIEGLEE